MNLTKLLPIAAAALFLFVGTPAQALVINFAASNPSIGENLELVPLLANGSFEVDTSAPLSTDPGENASDAQWRLIGSSLNEGPTFPPPLDFNFFNVIEYHTRTGEDEVLVVFNFGTPLSLGGIDFLSAFLFIELFDGDLDFNAFPSIDQLNAMTANYEFQGFTNDASIVVGFDTVTFSVSAVPIPPALPLLAAALGGLGFFRWRRRVATF